MAKFFVRFEVTAEIDIANGVLKSAAESDVIRSGGQDRQQAAEHIAYNLIKNEIRLSQMDGFADRKDSEAVVVGRVDWDCEDCREVKA